MSDCLFCKIIAGEIPGAIVHQDDTLVAFKDINPQAPASRADHPAEAHRVAERPHAGRRSAGGVDVQAGGGAGARSTATTDRGYRTVFNTNREAGQTVFHIHLHLLAGRGLAWPPG